MQQRSTIENYDFDLHTLAHLTNGQLIGNNRLFNTVSTHSKTMGEHTLFIPIKGETYDGHDFIQHAIDEGAVAFLSEKRVSASVPYVLVDRTRWALGRLAAHHRQSFTHPLIGLTGSVGKTTTKAMIASILRQSHSVLAPESSMNNDIGLPLTLLQLKQQNFAVIEMGTNHHGEIAYLTQIAKPDVALITNIGSAHLEAFKTLEGVAAEKATIFQGLKATGTAIVCVDDPQIGILCQDLTQKKLTFGIAKTADIQAEAITLNEKGQARFSINRGCYEGDIQLQCHGIHHVKNALAAIAVASVFKISFADIKTGLESVSAMPKRLKYCKGLNDSTVIDDSYSAIPDAVIAALEVLAHVSGKKIFIFGGMAELNPDQKIAVHAEMGLKAKALGVDTLLTMGELTTYTAKAFGSSAKHFNKKTELIAFTKALLAPDVTVLVKGSRGMQMDEVVNALLA